MGTVAPPDSEFQPNSQADAVSDDMSGDDPHSSGSGVNVRDKKKANQDLTPAQRKRLEEREKLRTSSFDAVTSFFMATILFLGVFVFMLFVVWLTMRMPERVKPIAPIIENAAGRADNAEGFERDFEPPGAEEVEELMEPTLQDTIEAVTEAVSSVAASLDTMNTNASASTSGTGKGDSRPPGPEGEGEDIVPRFERWQLNFSSKGIQPYAQQLDFYEIELGTLGGGVQGVDYASNLSGSPKKRHNDDSAGEKRLYFMWASASPLKDFDIQLLGKAGINTGGRQILKFIPPNLENQLARTELDYAMAKGYNSVTQIAKTIFMSKSSGNGYAFEVTEQRYRKGK
ncbi:hypothetical protein [Neorhodopirellula pilleata]|uniref:Transmembrane protein n=1 Tax=Neorhodopirellula pilleata TaxID=2714738 RepID=A0A5C6AR52_9BACT|nr:hypothetical protein [Neorhodopirellula pilleata]TWU01472.1 hypothetical protein Pla100_12070 [Neorhodopirellula pilleata]